MVDLYECLGAARRFELHEGTLDADTQPEPMTVETRVVETTDESGLLAVFGCVAL